mgnify:CR=1 FL=1
MKLTAWFSEAKTILDKAELSHLDVHKAKIQLQLKNPVTKEIEIHEFNYTAKEAENLKVG